MELLMIGNLTIYINVAVMGDVNEVLDKILNRMKESGLTESANRIVLAVCGDITKLRYEPNEKYQVVHVSHSVDQYEFPALSKMWHDSRLDEEWKLYIHTKGVSRNNPFVNDWVEFLSYFNIDLWRERLNELEHNDCTGVNLKGNPADIESHPSWWGYGKAPLHYSGNFWWTKSSHIRTLPEPYSWTPDSELGKWRMMPEMWVCSNGTAKYNNAFSSDVDHYTTPYPKYIYEKKDMKRKCAVFTIVKNEKYFLPIWLKHYKRFFDNHDIFVLDHQSNDGSTEDLDVNVVPVNNDVAFDHQWLVEVVQAFQRRLLQDYDCVLFAESDEILYSTEHNLDEMISKFMAEDNDYITCTGFEITQNIGNESELKKDSSIIENRNFWYANSQYNKPLLTKVPLQYVWGFHNLTHYPEHGGRLGKYGFTMAHLHRVDFELMMERHEERVKNWNLKDDGYAGWHHKVAERQELMDYFNLPFKEGCQLVEIPSTHKVRLSI